MMEAVTNNLALCLNPLKSGLSCNKVSAVEKARDRDIGLNPLKSGLSCNLFATRKGGRDNQVSIPLNRVFHVTQIAEVKTLKKEKSQSP